MTSEQNKAVVRRYAEAFNRGDVEGVIGLFSPDAIIYGVLGQGGTDVARPVWESLVQGLGMKLYIDEMVSEGDTVAVRYTETGTFQGSFRGNEPTGKSYRVTAMEWFRLRDGKIIERWGARDSAAIARQIGLDSL